ncbi:MAG TPA: hypothetical protein VMZ28_29235, partial [Kofleriaceae bacterium]|nr:hypothetical protein [Kofleriaceae bacterium]
MVDSSDGLGGGMPSPDAGGSDPGGDPGGGDPGGGGGAADAAPVSAAQSCEVDLGGLPSGKHNVGAVCRDCHDGSP